MIAIGIASDIAAELSAIPAGVSRGPRISGAIALRVGPSIACAAEASAVKPKNSATA